MILRRITPENFRNLAGQTIEFHPSLNLVVGRNGQGKTNLLEAIYFLATTKSFRTSRPASLFRFGAQNIFTGGVVERQGVSRSASVGFEWGDGRRRVLLVNGERVPLSVYIGGMSVFAYSSARLEILRGGPEERRRFLDRGLAALETGYLDDLTRYAHVLKQRNTLLHSIAVGGASAAPLEAWDDEFISTAAVIHRARAKYTAALAHAFAGIVAEHDYRLSNISMIYRGSGEEQELREKVRRIRRDEIRARVSLVGPQRDVVEFLADGRPANEVLSGGEMKMVILLLKFAKVDLCRQRVLDSPLFLLDDIDSELDHEILQRLLLKLPAAMQLFATSAKEPFLRALQTGPHRRLALENGKVTAAVDFV